MIFVVLSDCQHERVNIWFNKFIKLNTSVGEERVYFFCKRLLVILRVFYLSDFFFLLVPGEMLRHLIVVVSGSSI